MLARFFIDRPVLAWVISIVIVLLGAIAAGLLPIAEYPEITPPTVRVTATYPGANAQVVADTVAAPIEQQVVGVEGMLYMSSQSNNDGSYTLDVTFELGTDVNMAQVLVQNRVAIAQPMLPDVVQTIGVTVKKRSPDILLVINLYSEDDPATGRPYYDQLYLSNYATIQLKDAVARVEGVGDVFILGQQDYSMRVWLDPDKLQSRNLTAGDVIRVLREQNVQVAAGQIGQPPVPKGQDFQYTLSTLGRLVEPEQFANIVLKTGADGEVTYLRDVSRVELGARNQDTLGRLDGRPSSASPSSCCPAPTPWTPPTASRPRCGSWKPASPRGCITPSPTTPRRSSASRSTRCSTRCATSVILVALVILLFLQDWKALLLPVIDVAVSLVGTFAVMKPDGLHAEQPDAVRAGAGHRHRRGRRHRGAGEHRALAGQGPARARGHHRRHERDHRADPRHHAGAQLGAPAQRLPRRHHRPVLPPVRPDHLGVDDHLGHQRHDHDAGAGGLDLRRPQAGRGTATRARRPCRGGSSACSAGWRPCGCWRRCWAVWLGLPGGRGQRRGGARRPESHVAVVGDLPASSSFPARSPAGRWAGS